MWNMRILPTLRQLSYLIALYEERHFTKAAKSCFISQSALSTSISELEALLDVPLIDRGCRKLIFTVAGEEVVRQARKILTNTEELVDLAKHLSKPLSGMVRLGVIPTIAPWLLPLAMIEIQQSYPDIKFHLIELGTEALLQALEAGDIDIGLMALPWNIHKFSYHSIIKEDMIVACGKDHKWAKKETISLPELASEPMIFLEKSHCLAEHSLSVCQKGLPNQELQATGVATLLQMVACQPSATLLPRMAAPLEKTENNQLRFLEIKEDTMLREVICIWRKGSVREDGWKLLASDFERIAKNRNFDKNL